MPVSSASSFASTTPWGQPPSYDSVWKSSPTDRLLSGNSEHRPPASNPLRQWRRMLIACVACILLVLLVTQNLGLVRCPLNDVSAQEKAELRQKWAHERANWALARERWVQDRAAHTREANEWRRQRDDTPGLAKFSADSKWIENDNENLEFKTTIMSDIETNRNTVAKS
ncbi:hypothetical protein C8Q78DRAFT_1002523 [Trametes maxima]|nr:hypothetical protein C8Q78DRAFT_1002523 [Trametes maxima]